MLAIVLGLIFMALGLWGLISWWGAFITVLKGLIPALIIVGGLLAVIAGVTSIKDSSAPQQPATPKEPEKKL